MFHMYKHSYKAHTHTVHTHCLSHSKSNEQPHLLFKYHEWKSTQTLSLTHTTQSLFSFKSTHTCFELIFYFWWNHKKNFKLSEIFFAIHFHVLSWVVVVLLQNFFDFETAFLSNFQLKSGIFLLIWHFSHFSLILGKSMHEVVQKLLQNVHLT